MENIQNTTPIERNLTITQTINELQNQIDGYNRQIINTQSSIEILFARQRYFIKEMQSLESTLKAYKHFHSM